MQNEKDCITVDEAAKKLKVCKQRIRTKIKDGHFPNVTKCRCGHSYLIPVNDLEIAKIDHRRKS